MNKKSEQFSNSFNLFRDLSAASMSFSQELINWQLNSAEVLLSVGTKQMRTVMSDVKAVNEPGQWPEAMQAGLRNAIEMTRDTVLAVSDCQLQGMLILQKQLDAPRRLLSDSVGALAPTLELVRSTDKKNNKTTSQNSQEKKSA